MPTFPVVKFDNLLSKFLKIQNRHFFLFAIPNYGLYWDSVKKSVSNVFEIVKFDNWEQSNVPEVGLEILKST